MNEPKRKTRTIPGAPGLPEVEGKIVDVVECTERWNDVTLDDGTRLKVKISILETIRIDGETDRDGNPVYAVANNVVSKVVHLGDEPRKIQEILRGDG